VAVPSGEAIDDPPRFTPPIYPLDTSQEHTQGILAQRQSDQMDVVGHQAPAQDVDAGIVQVLLKETEVRFAVRIAAKRLPAIDAALGDVARCPRQHATPWSWQFFIGYDPCR